MFYPSSKIPSDSPISIPACPGKARWSSLRTALQPQSAPREHVEPPSACTKLGKKRQKWS